MNRTSLSEKRNPAWLNALGRLFALCGFTLLSGWSLITVYLLACGEDLRDAIVPVTTWRIERHVEPWHPRILALAKLVRTATSVPREQIAVAEQAIWHLVRYWDAYETWGCNNCIPSIDEMIRQAQAKGWHRLRGNCVSQSIILCSLLRSLGFDASVRSTSHHAWVHLTADGRTIDLLSHDAGQTSDDEDLPRVLPQGPALEAIRLLGAESDGRFGMISLLSETDRPIPYFSHPFMLMALGPLSLFWIFVFRLWDRSTGTSAPNQGRKSAPTFGPQTASTQSLDPRHILGVLLAIETRIHNFIELVSGAIGKAAVPVRCEGNGVAAAPVNHRKLKGPMSRDIAR